MFIRGREFRLYRPGQISSANSPCERMTVAQFAPRSAPQSSTLIVRRSPIGRGRLPFTVILQVKVFFVFFLNLFQSFITTRTTKTW